MNDILLVGLGSFFGGNARFLLARTVTDRYGSAFPYGTLLINITASFIIGLLLTYLLDHVNLSPNYRLVLVVGFIGSYSTFSTYTFDALTLFQNGEVARALAYLVGSVVVGMVSVTVGMMVGRSL